VKNTHRRHSSSLASILSIAAVLVMVGLFLSVMLFGQKLENRLREHVSLVVMFHLDTPEAAILAVKSSLESKEEVKEVIYYSSEAGLEEMTRDLNQDILNTLEYNPIPATLEIHLNADFANQTNLARMKVDLAQQKVVREVNYQSGILEKIEANASKVLMGIGIISLLFMLIAITLINGTIRLELYAQRFIIRSMQLVGAKPWFILQPFMAKGMRISLWAMLIAFPVLAGLAYVIWVFIPDAVSMISIQEIAVLAGIILLFGILLTMICSYFATRKYLRLKLEELY